MSVTFESVRFGTVEVSDDQVIEFPHGLIGLGGLRYALIDRNPGHGLPVAALRRGSGARAAGRRPAAVLRRLHARDRRGGTRADRHRGPRRRRTVYVTVRATPDPLDITANLRAPLVIHDGRGFQVINMVEDAPLQAPLFELAAPATATRTPSADAA